jgi:hypothetical protein
LVIFSQLLEEFHNMIECQHGAPSINGRVGITSFNGYAMHTPTSIS